MQVNYHLFNERVIAWAKACVELLIAKIKQMGAVSKRKYTDTYVPLVNSVYYKLKYEYGVVCRISFGFKKRRIFVHYGMAGQGGKVKVAEKHWWTDVMNAQYDKLAIIVADYGAEMITDRLSAQLNIHQIFL